MFVSHSHQFVVFPDPMGACPWVARALLPWLDQPIASGRRTCAETTLFEGMAPAEAELGFDMLGHSFRSYTRIAILRNPYTKMAQLYDRVAATDPIWCTRRNLGMATPSFYRWLQTTRPNRNGAGNKTSPRWRKFGAWSADAWCGDMITHRVRAEDAAAELAPIFHKIGISPAFGHRSSREWASPRVTALYDAKSRALIRTRYGADVALYDHDTPELPLVA